MLFAVVTAVITASGRLDFGVAQALSSRYVSGSVAFWCAQLCYWWIDPPVFPYGYAPWLRRVPAMSVMLVGAILIVAVQRQQGPAKPRLAAQNFERRTTPAISCCSGSTIRTSFAGSPGATTVSKSCCRC